MSILASAIITSAAIELGSGGIRLSIGNTDLAHERIIKAEKPQYFEMKIMESVIEDNIISPKLKATISEKLAEYKKHAQKAGAKEIVGIATEAFRKAENGTKVIKELSEDLGFKIRIIDADEEGELGYLTSLYLAEGKVEPPIIAWDTGKGSEQITFMNLQGKISVYKSSYGYAVVADDIFAKRISKTDISKSYNPVTKQEIETLITALKSEAGEVPENLKAAVLKGKAVRYYLSKLFPILFEVEKNPKVSLEKVKEVLSKLIGKTDAEIEKEYGKDLPFLGHLPIYIAMLQATMEHLGIQAIHYVKIETQSGNTFGMLLNQKMWASKES